MSIFDEIDISQQAEKTAKHFTDRSEFTSDSSASEVTPRNLTNGLDRGNHEVHGRPSQRGGEPIRLMQDGQDTRPRADKFTVSSEWISPVEEQRRRTALSLPNANQITDLEQRIAKAHRFGDLPEEAKQPSTDARLAIGAAREAFIASQSPDRPRFAVSVEAKDNVVLLIAKATAAVGAFESLMAEVPTQTAHFETLVADLDAQREEALKALRAANKAYGAFRSAIQSANALALEQGRWDRDWHQSTVGFEKDLNEPLGHIRKAIEWLDGEDDYASGRFLTETYEAFPPHTLEFWARKADRATPGSWPRQLHTRMAAASPNDAETQDAIRNKSMSRMYKAQSWEEVKVEKAADRLGGYRDSADNFGAGSVIL